MAQRHGLSWNVWEMSMMLGGQAGMVSRGHVMEELGIAKKSGLFAQRCCWKMEGL